MGAPAQVSQAEFMLMERVLEHVTSAQVVRSVVLDFRRPGTSPEPDTDDVDVDAAGTGPLGAMRALARERARTEARLVVVAKDVVAATGAALLAEKGFTSVEELSATATKKWRAEAKATAVAEIQLLLGMGVMNARRLVGLANAPERTQATVVDALDRGEASLDMALRFWERCARLPDEDGADVAEAMFGTDPASAARERLDPEGDLKDRPWHEGEYDAALEREALCREGKDVEARREQRRRARQERDATLRVGDDGMATRTIRCPLTTGAAIYQRIDRSSRSLRAAGDPRTLAQLRADITSALLLHGVLPLPADDAGTGEGLDVDDLVSPADLAEIARILNATAPVQLQVVIPWDVLTGRPAGAAFCPAPCCRATAAGSDEGPPGAGPPGAGPHGAAPGPDARDPHDDPHHQPAQPPPGPGPRTGPGQGRRRGRGAVGEILGLHQGFITPEHARVLAMQPGTTLARLLIDPADGRLIERSITTYRPDADMRRQVRAADVMSRMPGSRRPAAWCDIDHEHPWADGGPTSEANLNLKDRRPHSFKTKGWWRTTMAPNRDVTLTTLLGQTETTRCHDYRQYLDEQAPLDPDPNDVHPSQRADRDDRLDLACQALYAALVHRAPHAHLADDDDSHGATEHDPSLGGWVWVSHTNPDGIRRHGPPAQHPSVADVLGIPADETGPATPSSTSQNPGRQPKPEANQAPDGPWTRRADDDNPPF